MFVCIYEIYETLKKGLHIVLLNFDILLMTPQTVFIQTVSEQKRLHH